MKVAIFTVCLPEFSPEEAVQTLHDLGYDGIEWRVLDQEPSADGRPRFWTGNRCTLPLTGVEADVPRIKSLVESAGLEMPTLGTYASCADLNAVDQAMRAAVALGVPQLRINVPKYDGTTGYLALREQAIAQYRDVAALARRYGVRALIELHHGSLLSSASAAATFLAHFDPAQVGVIHDAGNMVYEGFEQYRIGLEVLGPYLGHVHLKNSRWTQTGTRPDGSAKWEAGWATLRDGIVDLAALFAALRQVNYDGWVSLEDFSITQPYSDRLRDDLSYVRQLATATN
jgi:sugar phosphate isomerase/epimerase